ncbi:MAG: aminomethyl-transferring glycine dehydrogenase subunit GcvPB [candidate division KSB1 bacterium]|jgi:glycine dehydrogenase subunit 2|nr:aminomethyl-transferring glycine dehydrogenase subunit GcvPB [candidate division KSB1 bacterium]
MPKLLFELGDFQREDAYLPRRDVLNHDIPKKFLRKKRVRLPQLSESEIMRHYICLSSLNHHVDKGFYPLGSCTMKYNPKINETLSRNPGLSGLHPLQSEELSQFALEIMYELSQFLCEISGLSGVSLQPAAGAHGELTGLKIIRAYHEHSGDARSEVLIPDSAHGTNPASVVLTGYKSVQIRSNEDGMIDIEDLKSRLSEKTAALMVTNPNTLGIFEEQLDEIIRLVHDTGALVYMDGANLNALLGIVRPGDIGFDVLHFNLHKTFSTPHGGGGPGSGPVGVAEKLTDFLPVPVVEKSGDRYLFDYDRPKSIGKVSTFYGNFAVMVRAYIYIRMLGAEGLKRVSENAIINANYLKSKLEKHFVLPYKKRPMHEFVLSGEKQREKGVKTLDIAKRLLDFGFHAPTVYFPLIVKEAMMIEPTETEPKRMLDQFAGTMLKILKEIDTEPETVLNAPHSTVVSRLDEVKAVREPNVKFDFDAL